MKKSGKNIKKYRKEKIGSQSLLAGELGISINAISLLEKGTTMSSIVLLFEISQKLEVNFIDLFEGTDIIEGFNREENRTRKSNSKLKVDYNEAYERGKKEGYTLGYKDAKKSIQDIKEEDNEEYNEEYNEEDIEYLYNNDLYYEDDK